MAKIRVLSPVGLVATETFTVPTLPREWAGLTVGFLDNTKANFELLLRRMEALLRAEPGLGDVVYERKANSSTPAPPEVLRRLRDVDLVVTGSAD
jgi:hypothetical protein